MFSIKYEKRRGLLTDALNPNWSTPCSTQPWQVLFEAREVLGLATLEVSTGL